MSDAPLDTATRGHHPDSPSSLEASEACPCFENEERDSPAAAKGTLQHKAAETRDLTILDGDEAMVNAVQKCLDYEDAIIAWFTEQGVKPIIQREQYLPVGDDVVIDKDGRKWTGITGGFPDNVIYSLQLRAAHVPDWKFGAVPVTETKNNAQGISYALAVFQLYPRIDEVTVHFYAPYQGWTDEEHMEKYVHTFKRSDMPAMELRIRTIIAVKKSANKKPRAKHDLCIWCKHKADCTALHTAIAPLQNSYDDLQCPDVVAPHKLMLPSQYAAAMKFASQVEMWAKAVKARCAEAAKGEGIDIPGFTLVKKSERSVTSTALFKEAVMKRGVSEKEFLDTLTVSITAAEKLVKEKAPKGGGAAAVRQLTSDLEESGATAKGQPFYYLKRVNSPSETAQETYINI